MAVFALTLDGRPHAIEILGRRPHLLVRVDGRLHRIEDPAKGREASETIVVDGAAVHVVRAHGPDRQFLRCGGRSHEAAVVDPRSRAEASGPTQDQIKASMPGTLLSIHKAVGDRVTLGETVVTIESMKLQMALGAPRDGVIAALLKQEGAALEVDDVIVQLATAPDGG